MTGEIGVCCSCVMIETIQNLKTTKWESYFHFALADFGNSVMKSDVIDGYSYKSYKPNSKIIYCMQIIRFF